MTLDQLRIFVFVAERLHMTRAAKALHITQSAASAGVAALEGHYGVRLFDRIGRGLALSEAGHVLLPEAKAVLNSADRAKQALEDLTGLKRGSLTIAASQTVGSYWLPSHMARFAAAHAGIALRLIVGNTTQVAQAVLGGEAELGFVEGATESAALARRRIGGDRIALYAAPTHPLAHSRLASRDLKHCVWVLREEGSGTRAELEQALASRGIDPQGLNIILELPSNESVLAAVAGGGLVTGVSELAANALVAAGRLVPLAFDLGTRDFQLLVHKERHRSRAAQAFLDLLPDEGQAVPLFPATPIERGRDPDF